MVRAQTDVAHAVLPARVSFFLLSFLMHPEPYGWFYFLLSLRLEEMDQ